IGKRNLSGKPPISGIEATFGPFFKLTCFASSYGNGSSNKLTSFSIFSGSLIIGYSPSYLRVSVITPVRAEAAPLSGEDKFTLSSFVPERPGKFLGVVLKLFSPVAGACPIPIQPLQPAWCKRAPD